jgi:hypothetical protein
MTSRTAALFGPWRSPSSPNYPPGLGHAKRNSAFASIPRGIAPRCEVVGRAGLNSPRTALHVQLVKCCDELRAVRDVHNVCDVQI